MDDSLARIRSIKSSSQLEEFKFELRENIELAHADKATVEQSLNEVNRQLVELEAKRGQLKLDKHGLMVSVSKARENIRRMNAEMKQAEEMFWSLKNQGL